MSLLTEQQILEIVNADCHDPFKYLGMHKIDDSRIVIRAFHPTCKKVTMISKNKRAMLTKIHEKGLYEKVIRSSDIFVYRLEFQDYEGNKWTIRDPYSFLPIISDFDRHLFNEGNHYKIYEKLGAHKITVNRVEGTYFSVWSPNAKRVSVVGSFNNWDGRIHQMRVLGDSGIWEIFIPKVSEGDKYKFEIKTKNGEILLKSDPYAFFCEKRPLNASVVYDIENKHTWSDSEWLKNRTSINWLEEPINVYELHLGSWQKKENNEFLSYLELTDKILEYVKKFNYTHIEIMGLAEHPLDISWGYQVTGYYAVTSRFGKPEEFMYLIDKLHQNNIGVIMDWVPGHFPKDSHSLGKFDGTSLYEHEDPRLGEHKDWGTYIFNYGRNEVKNFLISNALFWFEKFHIDGLRVDAVASMLYLDYSRSSGEWIPNKYGGRENLEAIEFLKHLNSITHKYFSGILMIAEESTSYPGVTTSVNYNGLGFDLKWNMGWMNDSLVYFKRDPIHRRFHQNDLTFSIMYAFSENFMLSISHDEVVHGKKSLLDKMPGDEWQKFANLRLFFSFMYAHPGKKLHFMGCEFGQWTEWNSEKSLEWHILSYEYHWKMQNFMKDLNKIYNENKPLYEVDFKPEGFEWIDFKDAENSVISFIRKSKEQDEFIVCVFNLTPTPLYNYKIGVPKKGAYELIMNTDWEGYKGSNVDNSHKMYSEKFPSHEKEFSLNLTLPPLAGMYWKYIKE